MSERIKNSDIEWYVKRLAKMTGWTLRMSGAYGKVRVVRVNEDTSESNLCGLMTKRELYNFMRAFSDGYAVGTIADEPKSKLHDVTVQIINQDGSTRNVTLMSHDGGRIVLLGNLPHATEIVIDQKLIDDLQRLIS